MAMDAAFIKQCADPFLPPAIIEKFVATAGSTDPLAVSVRSGQRVVLVSPAKTPEEALALVRQHLGQAVVRVGITQYPAGIGIKDPSELSPDLFDGCKNLHVGTVLFGKVWRIVWKWYGNPTDDSVMPQVFDDAIDAWKIGQFEGASVFTAADPGGPKLAEPRHEQEPRPQTEAPAAQPPDAAIGDPNTASIRIDLSGIGGRAP